MRKMLSALLALWLVLFAILPVSAADGKVTYDGNAGEFVFAPGSEHSLTDLFPNFKGVMPGDSLTQKITVKNDAAHEVKVKIYLRSLGAHEDSAEFLSQLGLQVKPSAENEMAYMFDATAAEMAGLTDWVCLGTLYAGGEVDLDVTLHVPTALDNTFQEKIGYLDWQFMVEEFPVEPDDPKPPQTGEESRWGVWLGVMGAALALMLVLLLWRKKDKEEK